MSLIPPKTFLKFLGSFRWYGSCHCLSFCVHGPGPGVIGPYPLWSNNEVFVPNLEVVLYLCFKISAFHQW